METIRTNYLEKANAYVNNNKELQTNLSEYETQIEDIKSKISVYEMQIKELKTKAIKLKKDFNRNNKCPNWVDEIAKPLAERLKEKTNAEKYEVLGPFGIGAHVSIYLDFEKEEDKSLKITLEPGDLRKGEIRYLTNESTGQFKKDTIGEINGLNFITKELPSDIDDIVNILYDLNSEQDSKQQAIYIDSVDLIDFIDSI